MNVREKFLSMVQEVRAVTHFLPEARTPEEEEEEEEMEEGG